MQNIFILSLYHVTVRSIVCQEYDGLIYSLTKVFVEKHVQTVTAPTCWPPEARNQLLFGLSSADISANFYPSVIPYHETWYRYGVLVDVSCTQIASMLFQKASENRLFSMQNHWILVNSRRRGANVPTTEEVALETFETHLSGAYVLPESNVFLFVKTDGDAWEIWGGFKVSKTGKISVFKHGTVTGYGQLELENNLVSLRTNLWGIVLKATTVISEPTMFKGFYPFVETDLDILAHMHHDLNAILMDQLNFTIQLDIVSSFGWDLGNGSFDGLTGQLQREECDFGGIGSFIRADRMTAIDYTVGTFYREPTALFKQPPLSSVRNICILPFTYEVWMVILFTFSGFVILIIFITQITKRFKKNDEETLNILDSVTIVHGAICQQGYTMKLFTVSLRVAVFVIFLTAVFLFTSYSASIVSLLQSPSNSIKTISDLVESSMTFSSQITPYSEIYFNETDDLLLRRLYNTKMKPKPPLSRFTTASEGINKIRTEFHGFMVEVVSAYKIINKLWREEEKCGLSEIQLFKLPILVLPVVKKSGYKDIIKQKLIHQQETGFKHRIVKRWLPQKPMCDSVNQASQFISVSLREVYPMIQIFGFGLCISVIILFLEIGFNTYTSYRAPPVKKYYKTFKI